MVFAALGLRQPPPPPPRVPSFFLLSGVFLSAFSSFSPPLSYRMVRFP